jgi:hypothetical protein
MSTLGTIVAPRFVQNVTVEQTVKTFLLAAGAAFLLVGASNATAGVIIQDFFGSTDDLGNGTLTRHDAAGNTVIMGSGQHGATLIGLDGLRAQFPDSSTAVWQAPGGQHAATWFFASASTDPFETVTPGDVNNLVVAAGADAGTGGHLAALLPFTPPAGAYKVSADMIPEGGDLRDWVAIGFTSSLGTLTSNFEDFGQAWLLLRMNATGLGPTTWELHTNGLTGASLTGNTTLTGNYIPLELTYDPVAHLVSGSISGVPTPTISYTATGVSGVGMEAVEHVSFGVADNFAVQPAAGLTPLLPGDYSHNGIVDAADYTVWRDSLGQIGAGLAADGNGNGTIDAGDYDVWKTNFGQAAGSGALSARNTGVPEPTSWGLLAAGTVGFFVPLMRRGTGSRPRLVLLARW